LERLIRYTARGAVALERLEEHANGDLVYTFTKPWSDGTTGITLSPLELLEKLAAIVPLPRVHLVRYAGCLAPHSKLREAIIPTPRQQGVDGDEAKTGTPYWSWARLLGRVFALDMATCLPPLCGRREPCDLPLCRRGVLRIIAAITHEAVSTRILWHLHLASVPPPIAPARARQETFDWVASAHAIACGLVATCVQRRCVACVGATSARVPSRPPSFPRAAPPLAVASPPPSGGARPAPGGPCCTARRLALGHAGGAAAPRWAYGKRRGRGVGRWGARAPAGGAQVPQKCF
jgi:hypothetical protein